MRAFATVLVFTTAASLQGADGTLRLSLADSPCPGLRERVETHLAQSYECVVLSRSRCAAAQFEKAVEKMGTIQAPALPEEVQPTCDRCVWVNAWNDDQYQQVPAAGLREIAWSVADVTRQLPMTNRICRERVPERSAYEQALAESIAAQLRLAPRAEATLSAPKGVTLAVLPFVRRSDDSSVRYDKSLPADQTYLRAEAALPGCLPAGARILARDKIRQILAEHQLSALADSGTGLRAAAHLLPADTLLCGTVSRRFLRPKELRLDLHLVDSRSSVLQAAWQGCCTNQADLPDLAAQGVNALMTMPWRTADAGASSDDNRRREAECLIGHGCFAEAWDLARACPDLYAPILNGVLCQAEVYCYADATDANHDTFERQMLREAALTLDDVLGAKTYLDSEKANVPWPDLIRAEIHFWLGEHADAERLCRAHLSEHPNDLTARAKLILAWALYGQKRFDESRARFNEAIAEKGLMWYFPRLGGKSGWYWANSLSVKLANASGDDGALYDQVRQKMRDRKLVYEPEMQAYLREVDRRLTPGEVVRELSSVLIYDTGDSLLPELVAQRPLDLAYRGWFRHLSPAYVVRGRCHEKLGQPQQAAEDYAMYLKICRCPFTADNRLSGDAKPKSGYEAEAVDGLSRLQKTWHLAAPALASTCGIAHLPGRPALLRRAGRPVRPRDRRSVRRGDRPVSRCARHAFTRRGPAPPHPAGRQKRNPIFRRTRALLGRAQRTGGARRRGPAGSRDQRRFPVSSQ